MPCTLRRSPLKMNSLPVALSIVLSVIVKYGNRPNAAIWSTNSLCTESAMLVWNSRAQSTRRFRATDNKISGFAELGRVQPQHPPLRIIANLQWLRGNLRHLGRIEIRIGQRPHEELY